MKPAHIIVAFLVIGAGYLMYRSAVSMPEFALNQTLAFEQKIERQDKHLAAQKSTFKDLESSADWDFLRPYSEAENWPNHFVVSAQELEKTKQFFKLNIEPLFDRNHKEDAEKLLANIHRGKKILAVSIDQADLPTKRATFILTSRKQKDAYLDNAKLALSNTQAITDEFNQKAENSIGRHPNRTLDINKKIKASQAALASIKAEIDTLQGEYNAPTTNYAIYGDAYTSATDKSAEAKRAIDTKTKHLNELDQSYIKVLSDQKIDYFVTIGRANWCESDGCGNGSEMRYPPAQVDANTFEYFDNLTANTIARNNPSYFSSREFNLSIPSNRWNALRIKPKYQWPNSRRHAEYWVDKTFTKTYHKYTTIIDGKATVGTWTLVNDSYFWQHFNNLGMAIETKPIGVFAAETITQAEPVGMATIAEPTVVNGIATGSNQYGEWRQSNGQSFWHYYGMYRLLGDFVTPGRYGYNDWRGYNSHDFSGPYYGRNNEYGTYGSSTYSSARYRDSDFSKRNPKTVSDAKTGRRSTITNSIRGAGSASRGRGPSGGGK